MRPGVLSLEEAEEAEAQDHEAEVDFTEGVMAEELIAGDGASFQENLINIIIFIVDCFSRQSLLH